MCSSDLLGAEARERRGAGALPRACHGGGEVAASELDLDNVARGGGIQRGVEWGQEVAGVSRVAVEQQEVACGPPRRRAALHCAGSRAKQRGREVEDDIWTGLQFQKSLGVLL